MAKQSYAPKYIPKKSVAVISNLKREILLSSEAAIQELEYLLEAVKNYKSSVASSIDLQLEKADLTVKYSKADTGGAYNLPGVMAKTTASYNLNDIKEDNARLSTVKGESERATDESELYYKMIASNAADLRSQLSKLAKSNVNLAVFFENLATYSEWGSGN